MPRALRSLSSSLRLLRSQLRSRRWVSDIPVPTAREINTDVANHVVVGADVSHPAPGAGSGEAASFAAITVSADVHFARYWAEVQTNGNRVEMVTTSNIDQHFGFMAKNWMQKIGQGKAPQRVLFIRDGVSGIPPFPLPFFIANIHQRDSTQPFSRRKSTI